MLNYLSNN